MKKYHVIAVPAILLLFMISPAWATDLEALLAQSIQTYQEIEAIRKEMREAVGSRTPQKRAIEQALQTLDQAPLEQAELDDLEGQINRETEWLEQMQKSGVGEASLQYRRHRLHELSLQREAAAISDEAEQTSHRTKLQAQLKQLNAQIHEIQGPFSRQIEALQSSVSDQNSVLTKSLRPFFKTPGRQYEGGSIQFFQATVHNAFVSLEWIGPDEKRLAWAHIRIRPLSEIQEHDRNRLLNEKFPIRTVSNDSVWVWAGHHLITFVPVHDKLKDEAKLLEMIHEFVDLDGLAQISAHPQNEVAEVNTP